MWLLHLTLVVLFSLALCDHHEGGHEEPAHDHHEAGHHEPAHDHHEAGHHEPGHDDHHEAGHHEPGHDHHKDGHHEPAHDHHKDGHHEPAHDHHEAAPDHHKAAPDHHEAASDHHEAAPDSLIIETTSGKVEGKTEHNHNHKLVEAYLGIPYGEAPVGELRFKAPVPKHRSEGIIDAKQYGSSCPQLDLGNINEYGNRDYIKVHEAEDCLSLNIFTPHPRPVKAAVLILIHGAAGLAAGSAAIEKYDGHQLVEEQNLIFVTFNFRLSELGFLYLDSPDAPGNMGLMDQELAFKWVQDNIEHFGGDPHKVTLMGERGGALSAGLHMLIPTGTGLFQQVVLHDGTPITYESVTEGPEGLQTAYRIARNAGCATETHDAAKITSCLREKSLQELANATLKSLISSDESCVPVIDGVFIPEHPKVLLLQGKADNTVKVLIGTTKNRGLLANMWYINQKAQENYFVDKSQLETLVRKVFPEAHDFLVNSILFHYTDWKHPEFPEAIRQQSIDFTSDMFINCPATRMADELTEAGHDVYVFQFSHHSTKSHYPEWAGVLHEEDVDYLLGNADATNNYTEEEHNISHMMMDHLGEFVRTGCPNKASAPNSWPRYNILHKPYASIHNGAKIENHLRANHCAFWRMAFSRVQLADELLNTEHC